MWEVREHGVLVRYADDVVTMRRTRRQAEDALSHLVGLLSDLGLTPKGEQDQYRAAGRGR